MNFLTEQIALMNQHSFGRKTEKSDQFPNQLSLSDYDNCFNEPEIFTDDSPEPEIKEVILSGYTRKSKTKRETKLEGLPARVYEHDIPAEISYRIFFPGLISFKKDSTCPQK